MAYLQLVIGLFAGFCTTISALPQIIQCYKSKSCKDLSWGWILIQLSGVTLWSGYGLITRDLIIAVYNIVSVVEMLCLVAMKRLYSHNIPNHESETVKMIEP